jgi:hypothetical protein
MAIGNPDPAFGMTAIGVGRWSATKDDEITFAAKRGSGERPADT